MLEQLITTCRGRVVDLRLLAEQPPAERTAACLAAMASGAAVIIAGLLPVDGPGHRVGRPDLLVRGADSPTGTPGLPPGGGQVAQDHRAGPAARLDPAGSTPADADRLPWSATPPWPTRPPPPPEALPDHALRLGSRAADFLQLAHYHRMLQACGFAAGAGPRRGDRHRRPHRRPGPGLGRPRPTVGADLLPQPSRTAGGCAACWSATTSSWRSGSRSPRWPPARPATRRPTRRRWSARSSTPSAAAATGGSTAGPSSTPTTSACGSTRAPWTPGRSSPCDGTASTRSPTWPGWTSTTC